MTPPRHVIVCGAGVVGAAVAYFLALRGVPVTVVERSGVTCAASGKSGGFRLGGLDLPRIHGLKGYSVTLAAEGVPAHALFMDYRLADGRALEPEIIPRPDGTVYVCGMADLQPLPESPEGVEVSEAGCATLAAATIARRQACYRPVTDDGLPLIGRVPRVAGAYVATGHGPWGMLNAPPPVSRWRS